MSSRKRMPSTSSNAGTSTFVTDEPRAVAVGFTSDALVVRLADGRSLSVPLAWLPRLQNASKKDRRAYELLDGGEEIRWPALDEDLSVPGLLGLPD
jgi:hypothetical protein